MYIHGYLRASTKEQDALRAKNRMKAFVEEKGFDILLQAIALLEKKRDDLHFVFAGATEIDYEDFFKKNSLADNEQHTARYVCCILLHLQRFAAGGSWGFVPLHCQDETTNTAARRQSQEASKTAQHTPSDNASTGQQLRQPG